MSSYATVDMDAMVVLPSVLLVIVLLLAALGVIAHVATA
jgi:hypothetical protein